MRKLIILILLISLNALLLPHTARAQNTLTLETLEINLWPEYDQPEMLVIYKGSLPDNSWPVSLTFRLPKAVIKPYEVAVWVDGSLMQATYTYKTVGNYVEVYFQATEQNFQLEYYDQLTINGSLRKYNFTWPGDIAIKSAAIVVQAPVDFSNMQFIPPNDVSSHLSQDNLTVYYHPIGALNQDQPYNYSINYQKSTNTLTTQKLNVRTSGPLPKSMWIRTLPWAFGFVALLVIAGGVWFFWRSGLPQVGDKKRRRKKVAAPANVEAASADESGVYCHRCGRRASLTDVFCRSCGTKLRT